MWQGMFNFCAKYLIYWWSSHLDLLAQAKHLRGVSNKPKGEHKAAHFPATKRQCQEENHVCLKKMTVEENLH